MAPRTRSGAAALANRADPVGAQSELVGLRQAVLIWQDRERLPEATKSDWYLKLARAVLAQGDPLFAYEICSEALERWPGEALIRTALALALARSGATDRALEIAEGLLEAGQRNEEVLGLLGRLHKDRWQRSGHSSELERSIEIYAGAYDRYRSYWHGINAATLTLCAGRISVARRIARSVLHQCFSQLRSETDTLNVLLPLWRGREPLPRRRRRGRSGRAQSIDFWLLATVGEAALVLDLLPLAEAAYTQALRSPEAGFGNRATTRRNAELILKNRSDGKALLDQLFPRPRIAIFAGHMIDGANRADHRFPSSAVSRVTASIKAWLKANGISIGYASAACGGDTLFHEALSAARAESHVVLPQDRSAFCRKSVLPAGPRWAKRFELILERATTTTTIFEEVVDAESYHYANRLILGMARLRERLIDGDVTGLALWDGKPGRPGGTGSAIGQWVESRLPFSVVDPVTGAIRSMPTNWTRGLTPKRGALGKRETIALLFADVVGFSKIAERALPTFVSEYLTPIGHMATSGESQPLTVNTWGDGLYMTFDSARTAGRFALKLRDLGNRSDWKRLGLPAHLNVRIGLHAGPAIRMIDPVTRQLNFMGSNVSRTARIEPVTPPGEAYCSQHFAALAEAEHVDEFQCQYIGITSLAKNYGTLPIFRVCPS